MLFPLICSLTLGSNSAVPRDQVDHRNKHMREYMWQIEDGVAGPVGSQSVTPFPHGEAHTSSSQLLLRECGACTAKSPRLS